MKLLNQGLNLCKNWTRGPAAEARVGKAESEDGIFQSLTASAVSSPSWVWGGAPATEKFSCILETLNGFS